MKLFFDNLSDAIPRKKPLTVDEQIATDKHGKRRFHGAFTGGFSAGFFNSVGSLEGWKPSTFKSTRGERPQIEQQLPLHFMDDEDTEEFGIAPNVLRTKPEYGSSKGNIRKRERESQFNSGPIPGEPVLQSILKPAKRTMGILLLMKMGWKPGEGVGEKLIKKSKKKSGFGSKNKIYGCARGPDDGTYSKSDTSDSEGEEMYRELGEKAPRCHPKDDTMGIGYTGLDRTALSFGSNQTSRAITLRDQYNKTIKVTGQAFGVGAFEEDDDDIYSVDDKSQYDFSLEPIKSSGKYKNKLAVTDGSNVLLGFVKASFNDVKKYYPGPIVPANFTGRHVEKKSRFDVGPGGEKTERQKLKLDANLRGVILDTAPPPVRIKEEKIDPAETVVHADVKPSSDKSWKPFAEEPAKQERYEKYLNFIKIGAKDLVHTLLVNTMSDIDREAELREFEGAARLFSDRLISDRFTHGTGSSDNAESKQYLERNEGTVRQRINSVWSPHQIVCKRFNIRPPDNATGVSLQSVADNAKKKQKFSIFEFLEASKSTNLVDLVESGQTEKNDDRGNDDSIIHRNIECEIITGTVVTSNGNRDAEPELTILQAAEDEEFEEPANKMDLFKAIFLDSDEGTGDEGENNDNNTPEETNMVTESKRVAETVNVLRNTSPPRGIFANLDLDKLSTKSVEAENVDILKLTAPPESIFGVKETSSDNKLGKNNLKSFPTEILPTDSYGPSLPTVPLTDKPKSYINLKLDVADEQWVEKSEKSTNEKHHRKSRKKHKKEKKKREKDKHKKKKKRTYSDSD